MHDKSSKCTLLKQKKLSNFKLKRQLFSLVNISSFLGRYLLPNEIIFMGMNTIF